MHMPILQILHVYVIVSHCGQPSMQHAIKTVLIPCLSMFWDPLPGVDVNSSVEALLPCKAFLGRPFCPSLPLPSFQVSAPAFLHASTGQISVGACDHMLQDQSSHPGLSGLTSCVETYHEQIKAAEQCQQLLQGTLQDILKGGRPFNSEVFPILQDSWRMGLPCGEIETVHDAQASTR